MTQDTAHIPLDERGLQFARDAVKSVAAYNPMGDISTMADVAIRAYLQTAAADVSGLVEPASMSMFSTKEAMLEHLVRERNKVASTLQTLSAINAALEAEIERLREEREACIAEAANYCWMRYKGRYPLNLHSPAVFTSHEHQCIEEHIRAALSAPKGGQDHG